MHLILASILGRIVLCGTSWKRSRVLEWLRIRVPALKDGRASGRGVGVVSELMSLGFGGSHLRSCVPAELSNFAPTLRVRAVWKQVDLSGIEAIDHVC